jgi:hypothetical protein
MLKSAKTFQHQAFQSVKVPGGEPRKRKSSGHEGRGALDCIQRSDSLAMKEEGDLQEDLAISQTHEDLFKSAQPVLLQQSDFSENFHKTYSP